MEENKSLILLKALVAKLKLCEPGIRGAFSISYAHGITYNGPSYYEELKAAERYIKLLEDNGDKSNDPRRYEEAY